MTSSLHKFDNLFPNGPHVSSITCMYSDCLGYMVQLVEVQQLRGAVGGDLFCCLLTEEPPAKKDSKTVSHFF